MPLSHDVLLKLKRWNTPSIYNGWEAMTAGERMTALFNREETRDFMPQMGPMIGYAVTVVQHASDPEPPRRNPDAGNEYRQYVASVPGPKIVVVQDLDKPDFVGAFWGEVNSNVHRALGCVGTITDGAIRDVDEMTNAGFKALASRLCVGHAYSAPVRWNCPVTVFGCTIEPGSLIHADKHGFFVIPPQDQEELLDAVLFMDNNECETMIAAARGSVGRTQQETLEAIRDAGTRFRDNTRRRFKADGEW